jgi:hypothetical protein
MNKEDILEILTTWKPDFGNGRELLLVTGIAPVTFQALQITQHQ